VFAFSIRAAILLLLPCLCQADSLAEALQSKRYQDALAFVNAVLAQHPDDFKGLTARGIALGGLRRDQESLAAFERALRFAPDFIPALQGAIEVAYRTRDLRANGLLTHLIQISPDNAVANAMAGVLAFEAGNCPVAIRHFEFSPVEVQNNPQAYPLYGACLLKAHRALEAVAVFQRILDGGPDDPNARFNLGNAQLLAQHAKDSLNTLRPLAESPAADAGILNLIASAEVADGQITPAIESLRKAERLSPKDERSYVDLGALYIQQNAINDAAKVVSAGLANIPRSARLRSMHGVIQAQIGNSQQAAADFDEANSLDALHEYGVAGLGVLYTETQKPEQAISVLRGRLRTAPRDSMLNYLLGQAIMTETVEPATTQFQEARQALAASIAANPEYTRAHNLLGKLYEQVGENEKALEQFEIARKLNQEDRTALSHLAVVLRRLGRTEDSTQVLAELKRVVTEQSPQESVQLRVKPAR